MRLIVGFLVLNWPRVLIVKAPDDGAKVTRRAGAMGNYLSQLAPREVG